MPTGVYDRKNKILSDKPARKHVKKTASTEILETAEPENNDLQSQRDRRFEELPDEHAQKVEDTTPKRKRKKEVEAELENLKATTESAEGFANIGIMVLNMAMERMPKAKPLTSTEETMFGRTFVPVCVKYFGSLQWKEEIALLACVGVIVAGRMDFKRSKPVQPVSDIPAVA